MITKLRGNIMDKKRIAVSQKRQITIPIEFFNKIGIKDEVECFVQNDSIVIRPFVENNGEFDEEILKDLISEGFSGNQLLNKFKERRKQIRPAIEKLLKEAKYASTNSENYDNYLSVFNEEE